MTRDYLGIIRELVAGTWRDPTTGKTHGIPIETIAIEETLDGMEADLVAEAHGGKSLIVVSDERTRAALGERVFRALSGRFNVREHVWENPRCTPEGIDELMAATEDAEALIAIGSGTISDSVKYGSFTTGREYSVFATSPMNAYTTPTASIAYDGFKKSITCHSARGVFFDLQVLAGCPRRLVSAAFADVICRTTAQVDWLMSHILFDTPYSETAYVLLAVDEDDMIAEAAGIMSGDFDALAKLTRVSAIMGLGTSFTGTTHVGSMAEHMISHYIDMFAGAAHPGTSHGEQVGVATLTMSALQNRILGADRPPELRPTVIPEAELRRRFGDQTAETMIEQTARKALDEKTAAALNARLEKEWAEIAGRLRAVMRPTAQLRDAMRTAGCQLTGRDLGLEPEFYRDAVRYSRYIRDRFSMLDVAGDSGQLEEFAATCE
ncbi:iron-containing alcohol dehydrogenase [Chelativorans sp. M5D2P16]|uniref:iron-containing alcohol dehydrogenase n=1 Tax=Chelativorans sp. M5D2P16 TaxID=3095678 RepID=UPI002ACAEFA1|nr:iron-containing alcohol dehydrogenase [Chelativorans sp. M5D2P16]MDZ5700127.1 iron-containing alcohol dehydrogenase [Chelativorans sp. M5D2P16]